MKKIYQPVKKKTILIVDDDQVVAHIYREKFERQGFKVEVAGDGDRALQMLKKHPADLVILDLCLPGMNGVEVLKNIRLEFEMQAVPVIVFSNAYLGNLMRAALDAGATRSVTKSDGTPAKMVELVRELLALDHSKAADAGQPDTKLQPDPVATLQLSAPEALAKLRAAHGAFARTEQEELQRTELSEMHRQVRSLAGSAGLLGFRKIAQMANALEALFFELHAKPKNITPSVMRTIAQAIDTLAFLFGHATDSQPEVLVAPRILIVDDEIISRKTICSALGKASLTAVSLDDSLAAQRLLEQDHFDLIFLDVEMPGQSGLELCVSIRKMATNRTTPVVFVTAHSDFGSRAQSALSGGNDFIAKPFLSVELAVKALSWLFKESPRSLSAITAQGIEGTTRRPISSTVAA